MHWLERYGTNHHRWQMLPHTTSKIWYRPLGLVEGMFDRDSMSFEGRTDINTLLEAELSTNRSGEVLRRKILLAWAVLRCQQPLLSARALYRKEFLSADDGSPTDRFFVVQKPKDFSEMMDEASRTVSFVEDHYPDVDVDDFFTHVKNTARAFESSKNLAKLFVLRIQRPVGGRFLFQAVSIVAHEIADALSIYRWHVQLVDLLNEPTSVLEGLATRFSSESTDLQRLLPQAQEDLYPTIPGTKARQRWFWAISRILRHTRCPPPPSFPNPLRRKVPFQSAQVMPPRYAALLDYSRSPPLTTYYVSARLSPRATSRIQSLCRSINVTIGSGAFALVAIVMMILYERQLQTAEQQQQEQCLPSTTAPTTPNPSQQLPFVATFPVNPRPFLTRQTAGQECSLSFSFSDGLILPFLTSDLPLEGRFRLLARQAHRQLRVYQKRKRSAPQQTGVGSRSAAQIFPQLYLSTIEWEEARLQEEKGRRGKDEGQGQLTNVQGRYPARARSMATCGVSSIGDRTGLVAPLGRKHEICHDMGEETCFEVVKVMCAVRAREGEFMVGSVGDQHGLNFDVSFDGCTIERERVQTEWKGLLEGLFDDHRHGDNMSRLVEEKTGRPRGQRDQDWGRMMAKL